MATVATGALFVAMTAGPAAASELSDSASKRVHSLSAAQVSFEIDLDARGLTAEILNVQAEHTVRDAQGRLLRSEPIEATVQMRDVEPPAGGVQQVGDYTCVVTGNPDELFFPLQPGVVNLQGNSYFTSYLFHPYVMWFARQLANGTLTDQVEMCTVGGGHTWNDWRQHFNGSSTTFGNATTYRIGTSWGQGVVQSSGLVQATLGFNVTAPKLPVGINGSVTVEPGSDTYTGNVGPETRIGNPWNTAFNVNRVNAFYEAPSNFIWDGSPHFQGNVSHILYEWVWDNPPSGNLLGTAMVRAHCGVAFGACSQPFN